MKIREGLEIDDQRLADICRRYGVARLDLFGSVLREDFRAGSDIDLLYEFEPDAHIGWEIHNLELELAELVGRPVDLVPRRWLNSSFRDEVLAETLEIYAA
jgi:predicted nucleotidyltransferase